MVLFGNTISILQLHWNSKIFAIWSLTNRIPLEISPRAFMSYPRFLQHTHLFCFSFFFFFFFFFFLLLLFFFVFIFFFFICASLFYIIGFGFKFTLVASQLFWNFHLLHSWSTICSGHTVPREMGVARREAFVTFGCQTHRWASTWRLTGSFPCG